MKNILNWSVLLSIFIIPFIPFIVSSTMLFPFITGKGFFFRILIEISFALWLILISLEPKFRPKMTKLSWAVLFFGFVVLISDLFGVSPYKSFWSNYERMEGFVLIVHLIAYYFIITSTLSSRLWNAFWNINLVASFGMFIYSALQISGKLTINQGGVRVDGTFGNATYLAIYLVINIFIALWFLFKKYNNFVYASLYLISILSNLYVLYFTATRGAILGLVLGVVTTSLLVFFGAKNDDDKKFKKISGAVLLLVALFGVGFFSVRNADFVKTSPVLSRFSSISKEEIKNQGRSFVWPMAIKGFKERPILGWGQENFNYVFNKYYNPLMYNQEQWFDRTHNVILDWLIASGIVGLLAYLSLYFFAILSLRRLNLPIVERAIFIGLFIAYFIHNIFVFDNLISYILFISLIAYINSKITENLPDNTKQYNPDLVNYGFIPTIIILSLVSIYFINIPAMMQSKYVIKSISQNDYTKSFENIKKAFSYNSFGNSESVEQIVPMVVGVSSSNYPNDLKQNFFNLAYEQSKKQVEKTPNDVRYLLLFGSFLNRFGAYDEALNTLNKAVEKSPNKPMIYLELGSTYLAKGDYKKALEVFDKAYSIEPRFKESTLVYAVGSIYAGRQDIFTKLLPSISEDVFIGDNRFLKAFADTKNYTVALNILNKRLQINKDDPQTLLSMAALYAQMGNKNKAIEILRSIIEKNPSFKDQGEFYIKELSK